MAKWITIGSRAYNLDSIAYVQAAPGGTFDVYGAGGVRLPVTDTERPVLIQALVAQGMKLPEPSAAKPGLKMKGGHIGKTRRGDGGDV